jgi:Ca2+-dependent lipid-binding protein
MMPASIRKEYKQLKIRFIKAEKLPKMDVLGTIDAYIHTVYLKKKLKTKAVTATKTQETFIEQEFWLPIQWPLASDRFVLKIYDEDKVADEIVGSMNFSLK